MHDDEQRQVAALVSRRAHFGSWNATATEYPRDKSIVDLFEDCVETAPDAPAILYDAQVLTYRQLNNRANQLAHHLRRLGLEPEDAVACCMPRTPALIVA